MVSLHAGILFGNELVYSLYNVYVDLEESSRVRRVYVPYSLTTVV